VKDKKKKKKRFWREHLWVWENRRKLQSPRKTHLSQASLTSTTLLLLFLNPYNFLFLTCPTSRLNLTYCDPES
jgi:hypothetical protein